MNKLWLIIGREYITRVKNWKFIFTTLLTPLGFLLFFIAIGIIFSYDSAKVYNIVISDQSQSNFSLPPNTNKLQFSKSDEDFNTLKQKCIDKEIDGILVLPKFAGVDVLNYTAYFYSDNLLDVEIEGKLDRYLEEVVRDQKMNLLALEKEKLDKLETNIIIDPEPVKDDKEDKSANTGKIATVIGGVMGYVIFFIIFLYGASVMRSVAEEKVNRIVEVIISSASATQLMLGKIIGVGLVGLTQVIIWLILIPIIYIAGMAIAGIDVESLQQASQQMNQMQPAQTEDMVMILQEVSNLHWWKILPLFVLFFIGGYFIYASMFAAIGAAVGDDINDSQSLTMFVSIPIIFAIYIMFQCIRLPESSLAYFSSLFPFFSPIVMPALLAFDPPWWQILSSLVLLFGFSYLMILFAARIYRTGILLYGKKASLKEIAKWMFSKQ